MAIAGIVRLVTEAAADTVRPMVRDTIQDAVRRTILLVVAMILFAGVLIFAELAFYLWLRTQTTPYFAALIVAGVTLVLALVFLLLALREASGGASGGRRSMPAADLRASDPGASDPGTGDLGGGSSGAGTADPIVRLAEDAEALGRMIGKDAKGYQLVLGALVIGVLMGRGK